MWNLNKIVLNGALVMALVGIWGWILREMLFPQKEDAGLVILPEVDGHGRQQGPAEPVYVPAFDYEDPFLKKIQRPVLTDVAPATPHPIERETRPPARAAWPEIHYFGLIRNDTRGKELALITVNKQSHLISGSQQLGDIFIHSCTADSAVVALNDEVRSYKINPD